ncbi:MAG: ribbon-helix-helix domain-containing protein [Candidatus Dormibacteria bacterium]
MIRKQLYLDEETQKILRSAAAAEGRSEAAVVREAIRGYAARPVSRPGRPLDGLVGAFAGGRRNAARDHDELLYRKDK